MNKLFSSSILYLYLRVACIYLHLNCKINPVRSVCHVTWGCKTGKMPNEKQGNH